MKPNLSVIIPTYNEEKTLTKVVDQTSNILEEVSNKFEIVLIDDGSTDATPLITDKLEKKYSDVKVLHHYTNKGYGAAQKSGINSASYKNLIIIPADGQFPPSDIKKFIPHISKADVIIGFRDQRSDPLIRKFNTKLFNLVLYFLFGIKLRDVNWVKLYRKSVLEEIEINSQGIATDAEIIIKLLNKGCKFREIKVGYSKREGGKASSTNIKRVFRTLFELVLLKLRMYCL